MVHPSPNKADISYNKIGRDRPSSKTPSANATYAELELKRRSFKHNGNSALNMSAYVANHGIVGDLSRRFNKHVETTRLEMSPGKLF